MVFAVVKILFGLVLAIAIFPALLQSGYVGFLESAAWGFLIALGVRMVVVNVARLAGRPVSRKLSWGLAAGLMIVVALVGPPLSAASHRSTELVEWSNIEHDTKNLAAWDQYFAKVPVRFQRTDAMPSYFRARAIGYGEKADAPKLRQLLKQISAEYAKDPAFVPARTEATAALSSMYQTALARLATPAADRQLQQVFGRILDDLSARDDGRVYLVFSNAAELSDPPGHRQALMQLRGHPDVAAAFPKGDAPLLDVGEAFSPAFDSQRRSTFLAAMKDAFGAVFSPGLLDVVPLPDNEDARGKWILLVDSKIARSADLYTHSREKAVLGVLSGIVVNWRFLVVDRDGKELYTTTTRSIPAQNLRWRVAASDPDWSPYSIMMDSAYYNYARQVIGRFGLEPPAEKTSFSFSRERS
jgi:hypothetical protein